MGQCAVRSTGQEGWAVMPISENMIT